MPGLFTNVAEELKTGSYLELHQPGTSDPNVNFYWANYQENKEEVTKDVILMHSQILRTDIKRTVRYLVRRIDKIV